jgi:hypothetical protein
VVLAKQRLLLIAAAPVLALTVSTSVVDTAHARTSLYESCENPSIVNPGYGGCPAWLKKWYRPPRAGARTTSPALFLPPQRLSFREDLILHAS